MPEMVPARRLSIQTGHQGQSQDGCHQGQDGRHQDRHLRPADHQHGHFQRAQGHQQDQQEQAASSYEWVPHHPSAEVKDFENLDQPVDLQKPREVKDEIKVSAS